MRGRGVPIVMLVLAIAACSSAETPESVATTLRSTAVVSTDTRAPETSPPTPPTTRRETTTTPPAATRPPAVTTAPATTAPVTTAPATTAPVTTASTGVPTLIDGAVLIHAGSNDSGTWQRIGAWDGSGWADLADDAQGPAVSFDSVSVASVDLAAPASDIAFSTSEYECVESPLHTGLLPHLTLPGPLLDDGYQAVAVTANWRLQPRSVTQVGLDAEVYQEVGESLLAGRPGVDPSNGDVVQVVRADLDGDGPEEVLVAFRYVSEPNFGAPGDFSIVYARFPRPDGTVDDLIVSEHIAEDAPHVPPFGRLSVSAVADLNGDGAMEVAIGLSLWEFTGIEIHESQGAGLVRVMSGGCGS